MKRNKEYYDSLDKRSKEYKTYKKNLEQAIENKEAFSDEGAGDKIERITTKTGIKKAVEFIAGEDCGCDKRKEKLNNIRLRFPVVRCFTEQQYNDWNDFINREDKNKVTRQQQIDVIIPIYKQLFARQLKPMSCCVKPYIDAIQKVYEGY